MRRSTRRRALVVAGATIAGGAIAIGRRRWAAATERAVALLTGVAEHADSGESAPAFDASMLREVPDPVARYLTFALVRGQPIVRHARVEHVGMFAARPGRWAAFRSVQRMTAPVPGFVWDARIALAPLLPVHVRDGYIAGAGSMRAAIGGLLPVARHEGSREIAASALWRYLAEAPWLPTALLPSERLAWRALDDRSARATLTDGEVTASADFHFDRRGRIVRVTGERFRAVGEGQVLTRTEGRHWDYARVSGMMVPTSGEVAWLLPECAHVYWRAAVARAEHDFARGPVAR